MKRRERAVRVDLGERSYTVHLASGTLSRVGAEIRKVTASRHAVLVTVPPVGKRYAATVLRSLRAAGLRTGRIDVPDSDATKNLGQVAKLYDELIALRADRDTVLVALGGGMVGDLTGFTAATYLRGIPFVQIPTTLLAMVDASVGGKTGVNLRAGKNLVGAFHQPRLVWADIETLHTLPKRQRAAGLAEVVKAAVIRDEGLFGILERQAPALLDLDPEALVPVLERAIRIKAAVVSQDERESGLRMLLNFGHTLAHAIEALSGYRKVLHGEAVAIGMVYAARRSEALGAAPSGTADRIEALCLGFGLPTQLPGFERSAYLDALRVDKKRRDNRIRFVVLKGIGRGRVIPLTPGEVAAGIPRSGQATRSRRRRS